MVLGNQVITISMLTIGTFVLNIGLLISEKSENSNEKKYKIRMTEIIIFRF